MRNCWTNEPDGLSVVIERPPTWPLTLSHTHSHFCCFYSLDLFIQLAGEPSYCLIFIICFFLYPVSICYLLPRRELHKKRNKTTFSVLACNGIHMLCCNNKTFALTCSPFSLLVRLSRFLFFHCP